MKTPRFQSQLISEIDIVDYALNDEGLLIQYIIHGEEREIKLDPFDAADLLKHYGILEAATSMRVCVKDDDGYDKWIPWEDFAMNSEFTEHEALLIASFEEEQKQINDWASEVKQIPDMIKSIPPPPSNDLFEQMANICRVHAKVCYGIDLDGK